MNPVETINSVESKCFLNTSCYRSSINTRGNDIAESVCFTSHKANDYKGNIFLPRLISVVSKRMHFISVAFENSKGTGFISLRFCMCFKYGVYWKMTGCVKFNFGPNFFIITSSIFIFIASSSNEDTKKILDTM